MKKSLLFVIVIMFATLGFSQQQLATLNHNDSLSVFYGPTALQQAHNAAVGGDVISLSSGVFNNIDITKSVTIRGNGMVRDTIANTEPTIINGGTITGSNIVIEGVRFTEFFSYTLVTNPVFRKCMIDNFNCSGVYDTIQNGLFINCVIRSASSCHNLYNVQLINSICAVGYWTRINACSIRNCIVFIDPYYLANSEQNAPSLTCRSSILIARSMPYAVDPIATFNCIGICDNGYFETSSNGNQNFSEMTAVFKKFNGIQSDGRIGIETDYELQENLVANAHGSDGTQIGVYGGMVPFDPRVNTMRYVKCNVAPHTTQDGKLSVDIEVVSE